MENLEARKKSDKILKRELIEELNEFPEIDMEEGLRRVIENECELLSRLGEK